MKIVVCAPDHAGTLNQALGVAEALRHQAETAGLPSPNIRRSRRIDPLLAALPVVGAGLAPTVVVSCGASGERKARRLKLACPAIVWAHVEVLKSEGVGPDLNAIPAHDWLETMAQPRALRISGVPHRIVARDLVRLRPHARAALLQGEDAPLALFLVGGPNPAFDFGSTALDNFVRQVATVRQQGFRAVLVPSRRTPPAVREAMLRMADIEGVEPKPALSYPQYLAAADHVFVTEDSISMTCEAVASGHPVSLLALTPRDSERLAKFRRFQERWREFLSPSTNFPVAYPIAMADIPDDAGAIANQIALLLHRRGLWPQSNTRRES